MLNRYTIKNIYYQILNYTPLKVIRGGGGGGAVNRFSDCRISQKKLFGSGEYFTRIFADLINTVDCGFI